MLRALLLVLVGWEMLDVFLLDGVGREALNLDLFEDQSSDLGIVGCDHVHPGLRTVLFGLEVDSVRLHLGSSPLIEHYEVEHLQIVGCGLVSFVYHRLLTWIRRRIS